MIIAILGLLGLCAGSFINALVWRTHLQSKGKKPIKQLSLIRGRSVCPDCRHQLAWYDLVPLISWLVLKGQCRYCKKAISKQYPLVELVTAGLIIWSYLAWSKPFGTTGIIDFGFWVLILVILIALAVYDFKWMLLPNRLVYPLTGIAIANVVVVWLHSGNLSMLVWPAIGGAAFFGLFYILFQVSNGQWIGGGDVKLAISLGLLAGGIQKSLIVLFMASLFGTMVALPQLAKGRDRLKMKLPFGPFLIIGLVLTQLYGQQLLDWYQRVFLIS